MKKEVGGIYFGSRDGKINLMLLISMLVFFLIALVIVYGFTLAVTSAGPSAGTISGVRNVNFTFVPSWGGGPVGNCSLWTNISGAWLRNAEFNGSMEATEFNQSSNISDGVTSWINFTFGQDAFFVWSVGCRNGTGTATEADVNVYNISFSTNASVYVDKAAPRVVQTADIFQTFNTTSTMPTITFNITDYNGTGVNISGNGNASLNITLLNVNAPAVAADAQLRQYNASNENLTCSPTGQAVTSTQCTLTISAFPFTNGTKNITIAVSDRIGQTNFTSFLFIVDQIPPVINSFNITNGSADGAISLGGSNTSQVPVSGDGTWRQGRALRFFANVSDNLTQPLAAEVQFYNVSANGGAGAWQTIADTSNTSNYLANSNISNSNLTVLPTNITITAGLGPNTTGMVNLTFTPSIGRGVFEGHNVTFRIVVNDSLGNRDNNSRFVSYGNASSGNATNITIQVNDTTKPTLQVRIGDASNPLNNSNVSTPTPTVIWNVSEGNQLRYVALQFDSLVSPSCNNFRNSTQATLDVEDNRNGSLTLSDTGSCPDLSNGTHTVRLTAEDVWGNSELYIHSFQVQSTGGKPGLIFNGIVDRNLRSTGRALVNNTNLTSPYMGLNFSGVTSSVNIQNLTYVSSCNSSSTVVFKNNENVSVIFPFNESTCSLNTFSQNVTLTVTVTDNVGNFNSTVFGFNLDNTAPTLTVNSPTDGQRFVNIGNVSVTVSDSESRIDSIGYFIDGDVNVYRNHSSNGSSSSLTEGFGQSFISNLTLNLTPGIHTIKLTVNDTLGNSRNSSIITFFQTGPTNFVGLNFSGVSTVLTVYNNNVNVSLTNLTNASGVTLNFDTRDVTDQTLNLFMALNYTTKGVNVTLTFNATAANWNRYNFSVKQNDSNFLNYILTNYSAEVKDLIWVNESIQGFLADNNTYYGIVTYPLNTSSQSPGANFAIWYFNDSKDATKKLNVTQCSSSFAPTLADSSSQPCWNTSTNSSIKIFVPHFSAIAIINDSGAPTVNVTTPIIQQQVSSFVPNISVSLDAASCVYYINGTGTSKPMSLSIGTTRRCIGSTENFKTLQSGNYSLTFNVTDTGGNYNSYNWTFNVSDTTAPGGASISSSPSTTSATVTVTGENETVNVTVLYGTSNTSLGSSATNTAFNTTESVSISSLTASKTYYYNVTRCDFNGNCIGNGTFSFTTSAAAASTTTSSSSSGGSVVTSVVPTASSIASAGRSWDTLGAGATGTLTINNKDIPFTAITVVVAGTALSQPSITVDSLSLNPLTDSAASKVYQYLQIIKNFPDSSASSMTINFKVPKSWLATNAVADSSVVLWRYSSGSWGKLDTKMVISNADYAYYQTATPGFSFFAIGSSEGGTSAFAIIDMIRDFYAGTLSLTAFDVIDKIRSFYGG